jgi:hypothetical protein
MFSYFHETEGFDFHLEDDVQVATSYQSEGNAYSRDTTMLKTLYRVERIFDTNDCTDHFQYCSCE